MINKILTLFFSINFIIILAQKNVNAKIIIDENNNLKISETFSSKKNIVVFPNYITLPNSLKFLSNETSKYKSYEIGNKFDYEVNTDKSNINDDFFITTLRYLGLEKPDFLKEKKFNLTISSKNHNVIFPTAEDLQRKYIATPIIVAGKFKNFEVNGFQIYYLEKESGLLEEIKKATEGISKSLEFYTNLLGKKEKPKIIFAPINEPSVTNENIIIYNSAIFKNNAPRTTISHEIAHIWFGGDGIIFKENSLTEALAEFLAFEYLKATYHSDNFNKYFEDLIGYKQFITEGKKSFGGFANQNLEKSEKNLFSYNLLPLYLYSKQKNDVNFINVIGDFYKYKKDDRTTSLDELNFFLQSRGYETLFTDKIPDFYFSECDKSKFCINSNSEKIYNLEIENTSKDNLVTKKIIKISNKNSEILDTNNIKKVIIDPEYKIQQVSRLNDIWNLEDNNIFNRNRYFSTSKLNPKMLEISNEIGKYFSNLENNEITKNLVIDNKEKLMFNDLKTKYLNSKSVILSGASSSFSEKSNSLYLSFSFNDKANNEINVLKMILKLDTQNQKLELIKIEE